MSRCIEFNESISADILAAFSKAMVKVRLVCEKDDTGRITGDFHYQPGVDLRRLAQVLNRKFTRRRYFVETMEIYQMPQLRRKEK